MSVDELCNNLNSITIGDVLLPLCIESEHREVGGTEGTPWLGIPENYREINVETEEADPDSILHYTRALIRLRKEHPILAEGSVRFLDTGNSRVLAYERSHGDQRLTVVCSFSREEEAIRPELAARLVSDSVLISNYPQNDTSQALRPYETVAALLDA